MKGLNGYSIFRLPIGSLINARRVEQLNRKPGPQKKTSFLRNLKEL
jgi:hypothetical protein